MNHLTGTISQAVQNLSYLVHLWLEDNLLHGTVPNALCILPKLQDIQLYNNRLDGTLPACLRAMNALSHLSVANNSLTGTIPCCGWKSPLRILDLGVNSFTGTLPEVLPSSLQFLGLGRNRFHREIPHTLLASMSTLQILFLSDNLLTGQIPQFNSSQLRWAVLNNNGFNGPVPWSSLLSPQLEVLSLANNRLSGSIAAQFPRFVVKLMLHHNRFSGALPSFDSLGALDTLTLHRNQCHGRLRLPQDASSLETLYAHNNRGLSCSISGGHQANSSLLAKQNLLLAGNLFSSPVPDWAAMHDAPAMYVASELQQWTERLIYTAVGLPLLLSCVVAVYGKRILEFFVFRPTPGLEHFGWWSAHAIGLMCVPLLLVMLPLYAMGGNLYDCGEFWLRTTSITYLSDNYAVEWCVAVMACVTVVAQSCLLAATRQEVNINFPLVDAAQQAIPWAAYLKIVLAWMVVLVLLSVPTALYVLSRALPTDNTLGFGETVLTFFNELAVVLLYLIVVCVAPYAADWLVRAVTGQRQPNSYLTTRIVLATRLAVGLLGPTVVTIIFSNDCLSAWIYFWTPCVDDDARFEDYAELRPSGHKDWRSLEFYLQRFHFNCSVTTHSQICNPGWNPETSCSRAVFSIVGNLILSKATLVAFFTPGAAMLMSFPFVTKTAKRMWARFSNEEFIWYRGDLELSFVLMFMEYTLIFGFIMPLILPLMAIGLLLNCAVYRCAVRTFKLLAQDAVRPCFAYLHAARLIGVAFVICFFVENDLHGKLLVCIGMPTCAIVGDYVASRVWTLLSSRRGNATRTLLVPLLDPDEQQSHQSVTEGSDDPMLDAMMSSA